MQGVGLAAASRCAIWGWSEVCRWSAVGGWLVVAVRRVGRCLSNWWQRPPQYICWCYPDSYCSLVLGQTCCKVSLHSECPSQTHGILRCVRSATAPSQTHWMLQILYCSLIINCILIIVGWCLTSTILGVDLLKTMVHWFQLVSILSMTNNQHHP